MDLDELRSAQSRERQASQLQHLRDGFYEEAASFIRGLRTERERAAANTDYSFPYDDPEVQRLTNEIQTAEEVVESLYERRVGKVVKMASFDAAGMAVDAEGLTAEESDLFETLVGDIEANRERVLDALAGTSGDGPGPGTSADAPAGTADSPEAAGGSQAGAERADSAPGARESEAAPAEDEPVHIGSGPAADGPVSTAEEDARAEDASSPEQAPTPGTENREATAPESESKSDSAPPAPPQEPPDGSRASGTEPPDADPSGDAMDAASAMGGVTDDAGTDAAPGQHDARSGGTADANRPTDSPSGTSPEPPSAETDTASSTDPASAADATADTTANATADTAVDSPDPSGTDTVGDEGHQSVPPADGPPGSDSMQAGDSTSDGQPASTPGAEPAAGGASGAASSDTATASDQPTDTGDGSGTTGTLVQVTADVGEIFGVDGRAYDLAAGDVAVLPADNAQLLVEDGNAERLETAVPFSGQSNRS